MHHMEVEVAQLRNMVKGCLIHQLVRPEWVILHSMPELEMQDKSNTREDELLKEVAITTKSHGKQLNRFSQEWFTEMRLQVIVRFVMQLQLLISCSQHSQLIYQPRDHKPDLLHWLLRHWQISGELMNTSLLQESTGHLKNPSIQITSSTMEANRGPSKIRGGQEADMEWVALQLAPGNIFNKEITSVDYRASSSPNLVNFFFLLLKRSRTLRNRDKSWQRLWTLSHMLALQESIGKMLAWFAARIS